VLAALALAEGERFDSQAQAKRHVVRAVEQVARSLGNTPAICRKSYIHPAVIETYLEGDGALGSLLDRRASDSVHELRSEESSVLTLLRGRHKEARAA